MRFFQLLAAAGLAVPLVSAWTFKDASLSITEKAGTLQTESFSTSKKLAEAVSLPITATARFRFVIESEEGGRSIPHQTYIQISDPSTGLETSFPADVRDNGRSRVDIEYKLIPKALLGPDKPLLCKLIIGSFGTEESLIAEIGTIVPQFKGEPSPSPLRFGPRPEIIHIFKPDPRYISESVASIASFSVVALGVLLLGVWLYLGITPLSFGNPLYSFGFFLSIVSIEAAFVQYYAGSTIFKLIAQIAVLAPVAFLSGSRALRDVRARRLAGK